MPLVPIDTIKTWYRTDSWVYRHFSYLFTNPLWKKRVPSGFSVCPFFWLALFSLFVFRPFVFSFLVLRALVRVTRLSRAFRWVDDKFAAMWIKMGAEVNGPTGLPTLMSGVAFLIFVFCYIFGVLLEGAILAHATYAEIGILPFLYMPLTLAFALLGCGIYVAKNPHSECKPEVYLRVLSAGMLVVAAIIAPGAFWTVVSTPFVWLGGFLWDGVCLVGWAIAQAASFIWSIIVGICLGALAFVVMSPILIIAGLLVGAVAWLAFKYEYLLLPKVEGDAKGEVPNQAVTYQHTESDVIRIGIVSISNRVWNNLPRSIDSRGRAFARKSPLVTEWIKANLKPEWLKMSDDDILTNLRSHPDYPIIVDKVIGEFRAKESTRDAARKARQAKCAKITAAINKRLKQASWPIVWTSKQCWTFACLLWELAKSYKTRSCPYLIFTSEEDKQESRTGSKSSGN